MAKRSNLVKLSLAAMSAATVFAMSLGAAFAQDATEVPTPVPPTPVVSELGTGGTHISFWNGLSGSDGVTLNAMLTQFVSENPDISLTTEIVDWGTLYPKLQAAFVAGTPPDVFLLHASEVPYFASLGVLADMSGMYDSGGGTIPVADFTEATYNGMLYDGVPYGVPLDNHGFGTWVNNDLLEAGGFDPAVAPASPEELIAMYQALTLDANGNNAASADFDPENVVQWGTAIDWGYVTWEATLFQNGGRLISEDGKTATANSPEAVAALQSWVDLINEYHVAPAPAGFDSWQSFAGGKVAVLSTGTWFRNFIADQTDVNWTAWPMQQIGPNPGTWMGVHTFMLPVTAEGEKLAAAQTLINWVTDHQADWAASGQVPARISAQAALDPALYPSNIAIGQGFQAFGTLEAQSTAILELQSAIDPEINAALNGQKTVQQALDDANARMQQILDRTQG